MGHKNKESIIRQVDNRLTAALAIGESRYQGKRDGTAKGKIYSWGTINTYRAQCCRFARWARSERGCRTLEDARPVAGDYLEREIARGLSPYTIRTEAAALAKLYGCTSDDFGVEMPQRSRARITRSREAVERDKGFSPVRNSALVDVAECTGLRRAELACLTGDKLISHGDGTYSVLVDRGTKGGRVRVAPVVGPPDQVRRVVDLMQAAGSGKVFHRINSHADIHHMRAVYASRVYARALEGKSSASIGRNAVRGPGAGREGHQSGVYCCRKDRRGVWLDREAMRITSEALGHSRINLIAEHYLYTL